MPEPSVIEVDREIQQLRDQLADAEQQGRLKGDARLRMFLRNKLRHLEAERNLPHREAAGDSFEQVEYWTKPR